MIRMRIVLLMSEQDLRLQSPKRTHQSDALDIGDKNMPVRQPNVIPHVELKNTSGILGLLRSALDGATRAHLAARYIKCSGAMAQLLHFQQRAADGKLHIVGMGKYGEDIDGHELSFELLVSSFKLEFTVCHRI